MRVRLWTPSSLPASLLLSPCLPVSPSRLASHTRSVSQSQDFIIVVIIVIIIIIIIVFLELNVNDMMRG